MRPPMLLRRQPLRKNRVTLLTTSASHCVKIPPREPPVLRMASMFGISQPNTRVGASCSRSVSLLDTLSCRPIPTWRPESMTFCSALQETKLTPPSSISSKMERLVPFPWSKSCTTKMISQMLMVSLFSHRMSSYKTLGMWTIRNTMGMKRIKYYVRIPWLRTCSRTISASDRMCKFLKKATSLPLKVMDAQTMSTWLVLGV
jgi:hypothetical protein